MKENKNMNDASELIKDFFCSESKGSKRATGNPHNILWILEYAAPYLLNTEVREILESAIKEERYIKNLGKEVRKILLDPKNILARIENIGSLVDFPNVDNVVRFGSLPIFEKLVEYGLDINKYRGGYYPLRTAIKKSAKIASYLMAHPDIRKDYIDVNKHNLANICYLESKYELLIGLWKTDNHLFFQDPQVENVFIEQLKSINKDKIPEKHLPAITDIVCSVINHYRHEDIIIKKLADRVYNHMSAPPGSGIEYFIKVAEYRYFNEKLSTSEPSIKKTVKI